MSETLQVIRRKPSFLDSSLKIDGILDVLTVISKEELYLAQLHAQSKISMKGSVVKYVNYCKDKEFVTTYEIPFKIRRRHNEQNNNSNCRKYYKLTDKGRTFLEMFE